MIVFSSRNAQTLSEETCSPEANQKRVIQENAENYQSVVSLGYKPFGWLTVNPPRWVGCGDRYASFTLRLRAPLDCPLKGPAERVALGGDGTVVSTPTHGELGFPKILRMAHSIENPPPMQARSRPSEVVGDCP